MFPVIPAQAGIQAWRQNLDPRFRGGDVYVGIALLRRWLGLVVAGAALLFAAGGATAADVAVPPLAARVTDLTGTLSASQAQSLEARLRDFERRKGSQIAVLMLPTTQPETIEQYSIRVAEAWKIGRARVDDGVILVVAKNDRKLRIEVGYGLEGAIPDAVAKRIVSETITPHFRQNDFYGGIAAGTDALIRLIEGERLPQPQGDAQAAGADTMQLFVMLVVVFMFVGGVLARLLGRVIGAAATAGIVGIAAWVVAGTIAWAIFAAVFAFILTLALGGVRGFSAGSGGSGWSSGGGWSGGGGFSGGGGGFGGGGASGSW